MCGGGTSGSANTSTEAAKSVLKSKNVTVDAVVVDDSHVDPEHKTLKRVFVFATLHPASDNYKASSSLAKLKIADTSKKSSNDYETTISQNKTDTGSKALAWSSSYYFDNTIKDVYAGEQFKIAYAFDVPESQLTDKATLSLSDSSTFGDTDISILAKDIKHADSPEAMAKIADPEGYKAEQVARSEAGPDVVAQVKPKLEGYEYFGYYGSVKNSFEFGFNGDFTNKTSGKGGTYRILNGYLELTYSDGGNRILLPYTLKDGKLDLDIFGSITL